MSNPILKTMAAHRSVRHYSAEPLSDELIGQACAAAQRAATSSNVQAYSLLHIKDATQRARLAACCGAQAQVREAGAFFVICVDQHRNRLMGEQLGRPHQANLESFLLGLIDATLFAQNLVLAFESMGLGTCFVGGLRDDLPAVDRLLGLPDDVLPLFGLCAGRAAPGGLDAEQRPRLPLDAVLMQEQYLSDAAMLSQLAEHDVESAAWYARQGKPGRNWSGGVARNFEKQRRTGLLAYYASRGAHFR